MNVLQLDFFEETISEYEKLERQVKEVKLSCDKVRKGIYARHNELAKRYVELHQRMDFIEKYICQS